jgi:RNA polymerase sigma-70 factor (ECF subfamily)
LDRRLAPPAPQVSLEEDMQPDHTGNPWNLLMQNLDRRRIQAALVRLPPEQRQVIELRYLEGRSHVEVAEAFGKTVVATRTLQHRAIKSLRKALIE